MTSIDDPVGEPSAAGPSTKRPRPGTAAAALSYRSFRIVWAGSLGSNVGTWMQNAVLGAYAWDLTGSATFVALLYLAQLGPQLVLAVPGGAIVDRFDRRRVLIATQAAQMVFSFALIGALQLDVDARKVAMVACVAVIGVSNTLFAPGWSAMIAQLVGRHDLPGAVSLGFVQLDLSRVVGPFIGVLIYARVGAEAVFALNGLSYLAAIVALWVVRPAKVVQASGASIAERMREGVRAVLDDPMLSWVLRTVALFAFFSLAFISLLPAIADDLYGIGSKSEAYAVLFACFGAGSALGAVSVSTVLAGQPLVVLVRRGFAAFAVFLVGLAAFDVPGLAFPAVFLVGLAYFVAVTALSTTLQQRLTDQLRGRVMALWFMCFGGTVPVGAALMSVVGERYGLRLMLVIGAAVAVGLAVAKPPAELARSAR